MNNDPRLTIVKERYEIAGLKVLMTTYHKETMNRAKKYRAKNQWSEDEADFEIDLALRTENRIISKLKGKILVGTDNLK